MNLSEPFIRRPVMTLLVMSLILFFGIFAFLDLPVSDMPSVDYPTIQVVTNYPGASPELMADNVTGPLERQFTSLPGINAISSNSSLSSSTIILQFHLERSIDAAGSDVQAAINQVQSLLPPDLPNLPTYTKVNPTANPIIYFALSSTTLTLGDLYKYGYTYMGQRLAMVDGVSQVSTYGPQYAVRVQVNPDLLAAKQIGIDQVAYTLAQGNPDLPTGTLYGPELTYNLNVAGQIYEAKGYNSLIIKTNNEGGFVRVSDVGRALDSLSNDKMSLKYITPSSEEPCVVLAIQKQPTANTVSIISQVKNMLPELEKSLPASAKLTVIYDQSEWIQESVHDVEFTLLVALLLVILVIFFYLGRPIDTIIPAVTIPITVIGTFAVMYLLGYSIDILSLLAITLSIGFLVDDAIVVLENIVRHIELGETPLAAAFKGSKEIAFTILSMTLCLVSVFIPLIFMGGVIGRVFREFAITIAVAVLISGCIALSLTPMMCSLFLRPKKEKKENWIEKVSLKINTSLLNIYKKGLDFALRFPLLILSFGLASVVFSVLIFSGIPKNFLPADDLGFFVGYTLSADDLSPFQMMKYQDQVASILQKDPNVRDLVSIGAYPNSNYGIAFVTLKNPSQRAPMNRVIGELEEKLSALPGINTFFKPQELIVLDVGTGTSRGQYQYILQSTNTNELYKAASDLIGEMRKIHGMGQVSSDMQIRERKLSITILRDAAYDLGISAHQIEQFLSYAYSGNRVNTINAPENQYNLILETIPSAYKDPSVLSKLYLTSLKGDLVPLNQVISVKETSGITQINHFNTLPSVLISFNLNDITLGQALTEINQIGAKIFPSSVTGTVQGSAGAFQSVFAALSALFFVTLFIIYVILGILYENFIHPLTVMSALPPATFGALLTLFIFREPLSLYSFVGIFMLLGIVLKNGIMMIDFANEGVIKEKKTFKEAIVHACHLRFRPILMTTFSALMGALPIALGIGGLVAESRRSLGYVIVGGLIISQLLTLFVTPVIYIYLETMRERFNKRFHPRIALDVTDETSP